MEKRHPVYTAAPFQWSGVLGWADASALGIRPGVEPHVSLPRQGRMVTGMWLRSHKTGRAMFFRLEESFPTCWLYVSESGVKLTVYNS